METLVKILTNCLLRSIATAYEGNTQFVRFQNMTGQRQSKFLYVKTISTESRGAISLGGFDYSAIPNNRVFGVNV